MYDVINDKITLEDQRNLYGCDKPIKWHRIKKH